MNWIPYVYMAVRAKEYLPGGSLKYLLVYVKVRIFQCSYRIIYIYIHSILAFTCAHLGFPVLISTKTAWDNIYVIIWPVDVLLSRSWSLCSSTLLRDLSIAIPF